MSLFRRNSKDPLRQKIKDMKCRQVHYVDEGFDNLCADMQTDCTAMLKLRPVNYYAVKEKYIMAKVYSGSDFEENYAEFFRYDNDKVIASTNLFAVDKVTVSKALAKVGIIIKDKM